MTNWVYFYEERDYKSADQLYKIMCNSYGAYGFKIGKPEWKYIPNNSKPEV